MTMTFHCDTTLVKIHSLKNTTRSVVSFNKLLFIYYNTNYDDIAIKKTRFPHCDLARTSVYLDEVPEAFIIMLLLFL